MTFRAAVLTIALAASWHSPLVAQNAPGKSAKPAVKQGQPAVPLPFANVPQLCQAREREIVGLNGQLLMRGRAAEGEKDAARRAQMLAPMADLRGNLVQSEASWQRLDCARILYGAR